MPNVTGPGALMVPAIVERPTDLPELSVTELIKLAREIATEIRDLPDVLKIYNLTEANYAYLAEHHEFFKQALQVSRVEWNSALTAPERVKLQSAAILEDALPRLGARMCNQAEGLPGVVEAAKFFAKIAGLGERDVADRAPGEKFTISINLGGDQKLVYKSPEVVEASALPIREDKE